MDQNWKKTPKEPKSQAPDLTDHRIFPALNPLFNPKEHPTSLTTVEENPKEQSKILTTVENFGIQKQPQIGIQLNPLRSRPDQERDRENLTTVQKRETGNLTTQSNLDQPEPEPRTDLNAKAEAFRPAMEMEINAEYNALTKAVQEAQKETLPKLPKRKYLTRPISAEANELIELRTRQCQAARTQKGKRAVKETFRKQLSVQLKRDWEAHVSAQIEDIKHHSEKGNSKELWRGIHSISGKSRSYSNQQPSADSASALKAIWFAAMSKSVSATELESSREAMADIGPASNRKNERLPTDEELLICLKALRGSKACGPDDVPVEVWRQTDSARAALFTLIRKIIREEIVPDEMPLGELVMIFKNKGSSDDVTKYRPIALLSHGYKVLAVWLLYRLQTECGSSIPENQSAFRSNRSCRDHITLLRIFIDRVLELQESAVITFLDLTNAFGSVSQKFLDEALGDAPSLVRRVTIAAFTCVSARYQLDGAIVGPVFRVHPCAHAPNKLAINQLNSFTTYQWKE